MAASRGTLAGVLILAVLDTVFNILQVDPFFKDVLRGVVIIAAVAIYARRQIDRKASGPRFGGDGGNGGPRHPNPRRPAGSAGSRAAREVRDDHHGARRARRAASAGSRAGDLPPGSSAAAAPPCSPCWSLVFVAILHLNPSFFEPPSLMAFLKKAAPL